MVASYLESVHFRGGSPAKMKASDIDACISDARRMDKAWEDTGKIEDFVASEEGYVTLENYLNALAARSKHIKGGVEWAVDV